MGVLRRKTWINIAATILVALVFSSFAFDTAHAQQVSPDGSYGIGDVATQLKLSGLSYYVFSAIAGIGSLIAWLGGILMDLSIGFFTVGMVDAVEELKLDKAISEMWSIIRDIFNLLFIFGLIFAGFKIILDANDSTSKKTVGMIVVAALLINFSLYVSQVVVDFTNVAAYQIHQMINPGTAASKSMLGIPINNISNQFYLITGLSENRDEIDAELAPVTGGTGEFFKALILGFVFLIFYTILGFVFAACAIILFTRFFTLIFLMIFSPVMFLGWVIPSMDNISKEWRKTFLNQALVGPALLFMIYLSLRALQGLGTTNREGTFIATIVYLLVVVAFLFASLKVARSLSSWGSLQAYNFGESMTNKVRGYTGSLSAGVIARGGRATLGRAAQSISERDGLRDAAARGGVRGWVARRTLNTTSALGDASFDARNTKALKGAGLGAGIKGYATSSKDIAKSDLDYAKKLGTVSEDDPRVKAMKNDLDFEERAIKRKKAQIQEMRKKQEPQEKIDAAKAELEDLEESHNDKKEALESEKARRQIGSVPKTTRDNIQELKTEISGNISKYIQAADPTAKAAWAETIAKNKKKLADMEKQATKEAGGYASLVENSGIIKRMFVAGDKTQNTNSAKAIREEYKKKVKGKDKDKPKEKEPEKDKPKEEDH